MAKTTDSVIFSDAEQEILELALQNPDMSNSDIAEATGYRLTLVRDTRAEYEDDIELAEDVADAAGEGDDSAADVDADLSETEQVILDLVAENPRITNAEIAEKTGARVALVRDTRDAYGDQIDATAAAEPNTDDGESTPSGPGEPSAAQQEILEVAASDHSLSNADIAKQTGSRITLVRDTLDQYDGPSDTGGEESAADTESGSDIQAEIRAAAAANPEATNRELADQTGARITLVRDTLAEPTNDETAADDASESDGETDVLDDVDTSAFSGAQLRILETYLSNPELTNAEIAAETDSRITLVRDTIHDHEYDEKPWVGNVDESDDSDDEDEDDEIVVESDDEVEIPDTTASELFNDRQRAILEAALENPELTNGEIADQTGARLTLVRDTRETYEEGVELADSDDEETPTSTSSSGTVTFTEKQKSIIAAAEADGEASIAELAEETGSRIPLVRDTLAAAEQSDAAVDAGGADAGGVDDEAEPASAEPTTAEGDGVSQTALVALVVALILLVGVAVLVL